MSQATLRGKKKRRGKAVAKDEEEAPQPQFPTISEWVPELNSDGFIESASGNVKDGETDVFFDLLSLGDPRLAFYLEPGDQVRYTEENAIVPGGTLQVLNKGIVKKWQCTGRDCKGIIEYAGQDKEITEYEVDPKQISKLEPGMVVQFKVNENALIEKASIQPAKPIVAELPDDKRRRIQKKFDEINEGGLATQPCKDIATWECPQCDSLNFQKARLTSGEKEKASDGPNQEIFQRTCQSPECGAVRPPAGCANEALDKDLNKRTYTLHKNGPQFWDRNNVEEWQAKNKNPERHTTVDELINKGMAGYEPAKAKENCAGCGGKINEQGTGCTYKFDDTNYPPLNFVQFYQLDPASSVGKVRRKQLDDVLKAWPPCICGLLAIPKTPCNVFRSSKATTQTDKSRSYFNTHKDKVFNDIIDVRLKGANEAVLYPSISQLASDQAMLCHIVPLQANGCKSSPKNIVWRLEMCPLCQNLDKLFTSWQGD